MGIWNGIDIDVWSPIQTLSPPKPQANRWYCGLDTIGIFHWSEFVPEIPLDLRFENFCQRLGRAQERLQTSNLFQKV